MGNLELEIHDSMKATEFYHALYNCELLKDSISNKVAPRGVSCKMAFFQLWNIEPKVCGHVVHTFSSFC